MITKNGFQRFAIACLSVSLLVHHAAAQEAWPLSAKRILFIGDSITHAGQYVSHIEAQLRQQGVTPLPEMINIGLGSETCSGLSEPDHPFPRPDVHERLERALKMLKPDVVVSCYGMNDGIYHPPSVERLKAYQKGVREVVRKCREVGAKVIVLTPPPFDPEPLRGAGKLKTKGDPSNEKDYAYFNIYDRYDDVLTEYSDWILAEPNLADMVIDLHGPMLSAAKEKQKQDSSFTFSPDGIHPNAEGHRLIANTILTAWGQPALNAKSDVLFPLVHQRSTLLHDAWLSAVGHQRPGVKAGLPVQEAEAKALVLEDKILELSK